MCSVRNESQNKIARATHVFIKTKLFSQMTRINFQTIRKIVQFMVICRHTKRKTNYTKLKAKERFINCQLVLYLIVNSVTKYWSESTNQIISLLLILPLLLTHFKIIYKWWNSFAHITSMQTDQHCSQLWSSSYNFVNLRSRCWHIHSSENFQPLRLYQYAMHFYYYAW